MDDQLLLKVSLFLLRLLGGFPYRQTQNKSNEGRAFVWSVKEGWVEDSTGNIDNVNNQGWSESQGPSPTTTTTTTTSTYQISPGWRVWSGVVMFLLASYLLLCLVQVIYFIHEFLSLKPTMSVAIIINDVIVGVSGVGIVIVLIRRKGKVVHIVSWFHTLTDSGHTVSEKPNSHYLFILSIAMMLLGVCGIVTINIVNASEYFTMVYSVKEICAVIITSSTNAFVLTFLYWATQIMSQLYRKLRKSLIKAFIQESPKRNGFSRTERLCPGLGFQGGNKHLALRAIRKRLLEVHSLHRLLLSYLALPITFIMLSSIIMIILTAFFITDVSMDPLYYLISVSYLPLALIPVIVLTNVPSLLVAQVEKLKLHLLELLHYEDKKDIKTEVRETLEVVGEWPAYQMCRIFTLDRSRLVEIFSFVATYLIILLQFRLTERAMNNSTTNTTAC